VFDAAQAGSVRSGLHLLPLKPDIRVVHRESQHRQLRNFSPAKNMVAEKSGVQKGQVVALLDAGDRPAARREAERALILKPDDSSARDLIKKAGG
jgi:hypothetical protein